MLSFGGGILGATEAILYESVIKRMTVRHPHVALPGLPYPLVSKPIVEEP